jgi:hypothetical protein
MVTDQVINSDYQNGGSPTSCVYDGADYNTEREACF